MSSDEALDALTGDFEDYKNLTKQMKQERMEAHKEQISFFNELLKKTEEAYKKSDVYKDYQKKNWGFSITSTYLKKNVPVIVGFNWGADKNFSYGIQSEYPTKSFEGLYDELGTLKKVRPYFYYYLGYVPEVQTNFCFFRSEKEYQISKHDIELCSNLFEELINYLQPSMLISFSRSFTKYFDKNDKLLEKETENFKSGKRSVYATKAYINIRNNKIKFYNLPHPSYPINNVARKKTWEFCFSSKET